MLPQIIDKPTPNGEVPSGNGLEPGLTLLKGGSLIREDFLERSGKKHLVEQHYAGRFSTPVFLIYLRGSLNHRARAGTGDDTQVVNTEQLRGIEPNPMRPQSDPARERMKFTD